MPTDFFQTAYLAKGTPRQKLVFQCLSENGVLSQLAEFSPAVVSTICLDVDIESSDIDIICCAQDFPFFRDQLAKAFGTYASFEIHEREIPNPAIWASFRIEPFQLEIFGSAVPVRQQNAFRHLQMLDRLIDLGGPQFREEIRRIKKEGLKTEPAIARRLSLSGDPYAAVLALEECSAKELAKLIFG